MRVCAALVVLALAAAPATAEVVVRVSGGQVDLTATAAPWPTSSTAWRARPG